MLKLEEAIAELEALQEHIKELERKYHHCEDKNAHLVQKINSNELRLNKVQRWGRTQRDYAHKYYFELKALQAHKSCATCKDNNECYTYRDIATEQSTFFLSCAYYKPKDKE